MRAVRFPIEENHAVTRSGASAAPNRDTMRTMVVSAYPFVPATLTGTNVAILFDAVVAMSAQ